MKCPKCELPNMVDTGKRQHDNCIVWFCTRCGSVWTFLPNGLDRTVQLTWDIKYIDYLPAYEKMPKEYIRELLAQYPQYLRPVTTTPSNQGGETYQSLKDHD